MVSSGLPPERHTKGGEKKKGTETDKKANGNFMEQLSEYSMPHKRKNPCQHRSIKYSPQYPYSTTLPQVSSFFMPKPGVNKCTFG